MPQASRGPPRGLLCHTRSGKTYKHKHSQKYQPYFMCMDNHSMGWLCLYETPLALRDNLSIRKSNAFFEQGGLNLNRKYRSPNLALRRARMTSTPITILHGRRKMDARGNSATKGKMTLQRLLSSREHLGYGIGRAKYDYFKHVTSTQGPCACVCKCGLTLVLLLAAPFSELLVL